MNTNDFAKAFDALMQETPYSHFDSGCEGIIPECRTCRFHRPRWKYQSCVFAECPYCCNPVSTLKNQKWHICCRKGSQSWIIKSKSSRMNSLEKSEQP